MNHEHIYQLLLQKRNGTISGPDDAYIMELINVHEDIELMWRTIKHTPSLPGEENFWHEMNADASWQQVEERLVPKRKVMWWTNRWLMAAVVTGVIATSVTLFRLLDYKTTTPKQIAAVVKEEPGLRLQLSNGETIALPYNQDKKQISAGNVQLTAGAKKLQYTAGADAAGGYNTLVVPPKMDYKLMLADGTEVWLNATTKLRFPFSFTGNKREVYLEGEAFFNVAKNASQPFIVHTEKTDIQVLGTTFNVSAYKNSTISTSLVSGAVASKTATSSVTLKPGQEAILGKNDKINIRSFDEEEVLAWMRGIYIFHNTSLKEIGGVIERWYGVNVVFDTDEMADKKFTGGLERAQKLDSFLETLQIVGNIEHVYDKNGVLHFK